MRVCWDFLRETVGQNQNLMMGRWAGGRAMIRATISMQSRFSFN